MNEHKDLILKVVGSICVTWILCTWMASCSNRYYAIPSGQNILDKRTGTIFRPGCDPTTQGFGKKLEKIQQ